MGKSVNEAFARRGWEGTVVPGYEFLFTCDASGYHPSMYEGFDPPFAHEALKQLPKPERLQKEREFWEQRARQRVGIATLAGLAFDEFFDRPDEPKEYFMSLMTGAREELKLADYQIVIARHMVEAFVKRREKIQKLRAKFPDDASLFEHASYVKDPQARVTMRPASIHFQVPSKTYERISRRGAEEGMSGGFFNGSKPEYTFENGLRSGDLIMIHEETHALYHMLREVLSRDLKTSWFERPYPDLEKTWRRAKNEGLERPLLEYVKERVLASADRTKDELFAFTRENNRNPNTVIKTLTKSADQKGLYDYFARTREALEKEIVTVLTGDKKDRALAIIKTNFKDQQERLIRQGLDALTTLTERHKFTIMMAMFYLSDVPLESWQREVRILDKIAPKKTARAA